MVPESGILQQVEFPNQESGIDMRIPANGNIEDISKGGVFITTPVVFPDRSIIEFEIDLPNSLSKIPVVAMVKWGTETPQPAGKGMGVQFLRISPEGLDALNQYVDAYQDEMRAAPPPGSKRPKPQ